MGAQFRANRDTGLQDFGPVVDQAHAVGNSWSASGTALGTTRHGCLQRFATNF